MSKPKPTTPRKPRPDFPLFRHGNGYWAKKVHQKLHYFGKVADDPEGKAALDLWLAEKDDLLAGRKPRAKRPGDVAIKDLVNAFLTHKQDLLNANELSQWTFQEYHKTCERLVKAFGRASPIDDLVADDFRQLRSQIARKWGPIRLANEIQRVRSIFKYGYEAGLLDKPVRFGPDFKKPSAKVLRQNRAKAGLRMFEREELLAILAVVPPIQKAMVLLAVNGGLGNHDIATLPIAAVNLKTGWLTYPRPKTGIERRIPLWPETIETLKQVLADRREPKDSAHKHLVFVSVQGESYISKNSGHRIAKTVLWFLRKAKIERPGLTFYSLRHTFQTIGEGAHDLVAVQAIMGHAASGSDMSARYRERIDDARLLAVTEHVRKWLFGAEETK
jgi:integrase